MIDVLLNNTGTAVKDFIASLLEPLQTNSDEMETFNNNLLTRSKYNGQKMVLQKAINEIFGWAVNHAYIVWNQNFGDGVNIYNSAEVNPLFFRNSAESTPIYFLNLLEVDTDKDFTIYIPSGTYTTEIARRVTAETNRIKLAGTTFNVVSV